MRKCLVIGHRGASGIAPENTLKSFRIALEMGADMIELDIRQTLDGELVCIHDSELDRTTSGVGQIHKLTLEEIQQVDAGSGEQVPLLSDVLDFAKNKIMVNIELKVKDIEQLVVDMVTKRSMEQQILVSSFFHESLRQVKEINPAIDTGVLVNKIPEDVIDYCTQLNTDALNPLFFLLTHELAEELHRFGLKIFPWTVNDPKMVETLLEMSVDGIISDFPEMVVSIMDNYHGKN